MAEPNPLMTLLEFYLNPRGYQQRREREDQAQVRNQLSREARPAIDPVNPGRTPQTSSLMDSVRRNQTSINPQVRAEVQSMLAPLSRQHRESIARTERDIASEEARQREIQTLLANVGTRPAPIPSYATSPGAMGAVVSGPRPRPSPTPAPRPVLDRLPRQFNLSAFAPPPPISDEITVRPPWYSYPELERSGGPFQPMGPTPRPAPQPQPQSRPSAPLIAQAPPQYINAGADRSALTAPLRPRPQDLPINGGGFQTMSPDSPFERPPDLPYNAESPRDAYGFIPPQVLGGGQGPFTLPDTDRADVYPPPEAVDFPFYASMNAPMGSGPTPAPPPMRSVPNPPAQPIPQSARSQLPTPTPQLGQNMPADVKAALIAELQALSLERLKAQQQAGAGQNVGRVGLEAR